MILTRKPGNCLNNEGTTLRTL